MQSLSGPDGARSSTVPPIRPSQSRTPVAQRPLPKPEDVSQPLLKHLQDRLVLAYEATNSNGRRPSTAEAVADAIRFMKDDILTVGPKGRKTLELFFGEMLLGLRRSNSSTALHFARVAESLDQVGQRYLYDRILTDATGQNFYSQKNYLTGKYLHSLRKAAPPTPSGATIRISTLLDSIVAGLGDDITDIEATSFPDSANAARAEAFKIFMNSKARSLDFDSIEEQPKYIRKLVAMTDSYGSLESLGPLVDRLKNTYAIDLVGQALATVSDPKSGWQLLDRAYGPKVARKKFIDFYESAVASKGLYKDADSAQR